VRKRVKGSVWIEFSEDIDGKRYRHTIKADDTDLVLVSTSTVEDLGNGRNGAAVHNFEVKVPGFEAHL
jgi:hypothetical protein